MRKIIIILLSFICIAGSDAQNNITFSSGYSLISSHKLHGFYTSIKTELGNKSIKCYVDLSYNYADGNINFNKETDYIIKFTNTNEIIKYPLYIGMTPDDYPIMLSVRTSNIYQYTGTIGIKYHTPKLDRFDFLLGLYSVYVNKSYLAIHMKDVYLKGLGGVYIDGNSEFWIPYHIRYFDIGPCAGIDFRLWDFEKVNIGLSSSWYIGFKKNGWFNLGVYSTFKLK